MYYFNDMKSVDYFFFIIIIVLILFFNYRIDENFSFYADNSTKYFQAYSVIENSFKDDFIRCKWLEDFEYCKYHILTNTMISSETELKGVFPFYLSYVNAFFIYFFGNSFFIWYPQILFILIIFIMYKLYNNIFIPAVLFFSTPLFYFFITFTDVSLNIFFFSFVFIFLSLRDQLKDYQIILLGIITGINIFFRYEGSIFVGILFTLLILLDSSNQKKYIMFISGLIISTLLFFILNIIYYENLLGNRFDVNKESILNWDILNKIMIIVGNLWGIQIHPVGFFKFMPYLLVLYVVFLFYKKRFSKEEKILYYSILISLSVIISLAPNDSNADYGTRYLSVLIIPSLILLYKSILTINKKIYTLIILILFLISFYYNIKYTKVIVKMNDNGKYMYQSLKEDFQKNSLWIFYSDYWPSVYGAYIFNNKVVVLRSIEESNKFLDLLENHKLLNKYKKILIFNFHMNLQNVPEKYFDIFFEDPEVTKKVQNFFKKNSFQYDLNKIKYDKDTDIEFHYFFLK